MSKGTTYTKRNGRSAFGPLILIAIGGFFLLQNLGRLPDANWGTLFQLWPLALVLVGLNLVVQQAPHPLGGVLSGLVGITAVLIAGYVLFFSEDNALLSRLGIRTSAPVMLTESIAFAPDDISAADIELNFSFTGGDVFALEPNEGLINGTVSFPEKLIFETTEEDNGEVSVLLDTGNGAPWNWFDNNEGDRWAIGLNPRTPLNLRINSGAGQVDFDLDELSLADLDIDLGAGSSVMTLPNGDYEVKLDVGAGSTRVVFPENGRIDSKFDGGAGSFNIIIPEGMPARIDIDRGVGGINLDDRFQLVEGERGDDSVWETADYSDEGDGIELKVDVGAGSVTVRSGE